MIQILRNAELPPVLAHQQLHAVLRRFILHNHSFVWSGSVLQRTHQFGSKSPELSVDPTVLDPELKPKGAGRRIAMRGTPDSDSLNIMALLLAVKSRLTRPGMIGNR